MSTLKEKNPACYTCRSVYTWNLEDCPVLLFCCWAKVIKTLWLKYMYPYIYTLNVYTVFIIFSFNSLYFYVT